MAQFTALLISFAMSSVTSIPSERIRSPYIFAKLGLYSTNVSLTSKIIALYIMFFLIAESAQASWKLKKIQSGKIDLKNPILRISV